MSEPGASGGAMDTAHPLAHATAGAPVPWRENAGPILFMAALFLLSIGLAMAFSSTFDAADVRAFEDPESLANPLIYLVIVVVFTFIVLLIAKYGKRILIKWIILGAVLLTIYSVLWPLLGLALPLGGPPLGLGTAGAIALGTAALLTVLLYVYPEWYVIDLTGVLVAAGAAGIFGISFGLLPSLLLLTAFAVYDAIAVYGSKHMLDLADSVLELRLPIMFVVPKHRGYSFLEETARIQEPAPADAKPREAMFMGLGDAVIPAVLVVSAMTFLPATVTVAGVSGALVVALATLAGSFLGFCALMYFVLKGNAHAGLPLLNGGAILGFFLTLLPLYGLAPLNPFG
jgi:presenilin-like A22 family membrane protease